MKLKTDSQQKKLKKEVVATTASLSIFVGMFLTGLFCVLHPDLRTRLRHRFKQQFREVLSTAKGPLLANFTSSHVIKVRTHEGIFIEIYGVGNVGEVHPLLDQVQLPDRQDGYFGVGNAGEVHPLLDRVQLPDRQDGYFSFKGKTSNLFVHDVDGDQVAEIIVPSFDENLVAHLNVFSFNQKTLKLEPKNSPIGR